MYVHFKPQWKTYFSASVFTVFSILTCECLQSPQNLLWNRASSSQSGTWTEHPGEGRSSWARGMLRIGMKGRWLKRRTPLWVSCGQSVWHWWREENNKSYSCWQCTTNNKISVKNITCRTCIITMSHEQHWFWSGYRDLPNLTSVWCFDTWKTHIINWWMKNFNHTITCHQVNLRNVIQQLRYRPFATMTEYKCSINAKQMRPRSWTVTQSKLVY